MKPSPIFDAAFERTFGSDFERIFGTEKNPITSPADPFALSPEMMAEGDITAERR